MLVGCLFDVRCWLLLWSSSRARSTSDPIDTHIHTREYCVHTRTYMHVHTCIYTRTRIYSTYGTYTRTFARTCTRTHTHEHTHRTHRRISYSRYTRTYSTCTRAYSPYTRAYARAYTHLRTHTHAPGPARDRDHEEAGAPQHRPARRGHRRPARQLSVHGHGVRGERRGHALRRARERTLRLSPKRYVQGFFPPAHFSYAHPICHDSLLTSPNGARDLLFGASYGARYTVRTW